MNLFLKKLQDKIDYYKDINTRSSEIVIDILISNQKVLIELNQGQLYNEGIGSDGKDIRPYYRPYTVRVKSEKDQITEHVTLYDEGNFYGGFQVTKQDKESVLIDSNDSKTEELTLKYGGQIFGLSPDSFKEVRDYYVFVEMIKKLKNG